MSFKLSDINIALETLLKVFKEAASKDGDKQTLNRDELHDLITKQLPSLVKPGFDEQFDCFFKELEGGRGTNVNFREFMCLLATIVVLRENLK